MTTPFMNRHFDIKKKSWYIGENKEGIQVVRKTINDFYIRVTNIIEASEEIREINGQINKFGSINRFTGFIKSNEYIDKDIEKNVAEKAAKDFYNADE